MDNYLFISDAAKEVKVESHVLRYWEEELHLPIKRNELGHRYYTAEDVERFKQIKGMKERGLQLKAIKMILKDGKLDMLVPKQGAGEGTEKEKNIEKSNSVDAGQGTGQDMGQSAGQSMRQGMGQGTVPNSGQSMRQGMGQGTGPNSGQSAAQGIKQNISRNMRQDGTANDMPIDIVEAKAMAVSTADSKEDKSRRLQWLLQQLIRETLRENNSDLCREIKESVVKELDYQFRMQEEREEARDKLLAERSEEHYRKMDELLRKKAKKKILHGRSKESVKEKAKETAKENAESETVKDILEFSGEKMIKDNILDRNPTEKTEKKKKRFIF